MRSDLLEKVTSKAFEIAAFSIFGLLFVAKPTTLVPSLVLLIASISVLGNVAFRYKFRNVFTNSPYTWIAYSVLVWFIVALLLALIHWSQEKFYFPENALRMVMALTLLAMDTKTRAKQSFLVGLIVAGLASAYWSIQAWPWSLESRAQGTTNNAIHFGNLSAIVTVFSLTFLLFAAEISRKMRILLLMAGIGGLIGAVGSLSRSSYVVFLCFLPLGIIATNKHSKKWNGNVVSILVIATCIAMLMFSSVRDKLRVSEALVDIQRIQNGYYKTSLGARAAMWQIAWDVFEENPILGLGPGHFQSEIDRRMQSGEMPSTGIRNQPHSDIMHALSSGGLLKFLSYVGILAAPFVFFYRRFKDTKNYDERRLISVMGMQLVAAYFLTGLTNSNFDLQIYSTTYAVLVCVLAKLSMQPESES